MKLTILMYHKIDEVPPDARFPGNYVSPGDFAQQLDALLEWGYQTINFGEWLRYRTDSSWRFLVRPVIILLRADECADATPGMYGRSTASCPSRAIQPWIRRRR